MKLHSGMIPLFHAIIFIYPTRPYGQVKTPEIQENKVGFDMKTLSKFMILFSVVLVLMAALIACGDDPGPDPGKDPEIPSYLQGTRWENKNRNQIAFTKTTVKGWDTYTLKTITTIDSNNIQLIFKELEPTEAITVKNKNVSMVNFKYIDENYRSGPDQWMYHFEDAVENNMKFEYHRFYTGYFLDGLGLLLDGYVLTEYTGTDTVVNIPANINGIPVKAIGDTAFYYYESHLIDPPTRIKLTSVTLPNSIIIIKSAAFADNLLTNITIPNGVVIIENNAFNDNNLTSIVLPPSVTTLGGGGGRGSPFPDTITSVTIGANVNGDNFGFKYGGINNFNAVYNNNNKAAGTYTYFATSDIPYGWGWRKTN
jgi:hypothetical protein